MKTWPKNFSFMFHCCAELMAHVGFFKLRQPKKTVGVFCSVTLPCRFPNGPFCAGGIEMFFLVRGEGDYLVKYRRW